MDLGYGWPYVAVVQPGRLNLGDLNTHVQPGHCTQVPHGGGESQRRKEGVYWVAGNPGHTAEHPALGIMGGHIRHLDEAAGACRLSLWKTTHQRCCHKAASPKRALLAAWDAAREHRVPGRRLASGGGWSLVPEGAFAPTHRTAYPKAWLCATREPESSAGTGL